MQRYVIFAGVNGAGKSTLYQTADASIQELPRVNTDEIVRSIGDWRNTNDVFAAGKMAIKKIKEHFDNFESFNQETTLCGKSIFNNINLAKSMGYQVELHYVGVASAEIAKERVTHRVSCGGHGIPEEDIERRYVESLQNLKKVLPLCDKAILYDNTDYFQRFAIYENHEFLYLSQNLPDWFQKLELVREEPAHESLEHKIQRVQEELSKENHSEKTILKEDVSIEH